MARIRTIKPEFWEDEKIGKLPIPCRLFFIGCWNFADDFGVIKNNPILLKSQIFPYDENLRVSEIKKWIDALVNAQMLIPIILDGEENRLAEESYYLIRTFRSHQVLDKRYEKSYISKDKNFVKSLINKVLEERSVNTTSLHSEHIVNTPEEREMEDKEKSSIEDSKKYIDFLFVDESFREVFGDWLEYKKARRENYKTQKSLKACYNKLYKLSQGNPATASEIVEQSMANNWAGLFELKTERNGNNRNPYPSKQEANDYAIQQYLADREAIYQGLHDSAEKPF